MNSPRQPSLISRFLLAGGALLLIFLIVGVPTIYELMTRPSSSSRPWYTLLVPSGMKGATVAYFFFVSSAVGSFINVVAYRMPIGKSVIFNASACPRCRQGIKGRDNIPVFGWILLGGKCRNCDLAISRRYPLVEFWFGFFAVVLMFFELLIGAANIPGNDLPYRSGVVEMIWGLNRPALAVYGFHCFLIGTLTTWSLFKLDRNQIPAMAAIFPLATVLVLVGLYQPLHPVLGMAYEFENLAVGQLSSSLLGLAAGFVLGFVVELAVGNVGFNATGNKGLWLAIGLTGCMLGWQAALSACMLFGILFFFSRFLTGVLFLANGPILGIFTFATLVQICLWKALDGVSMWPASSLGMESILFGLAVTFGMIASARYLVPGGAQLDDYRPEGYGEEVPELFEPIVDPGVSDSGVFEKDSPGNDDEGLPSSDESQMASDSDVNDEDHSTDEEDNQP